MVAYLLLGVAQAVGLLLIPFGVPGLWLQLGSLALFAWWGGFSLIGIVALLVLSGIALSAELLQIPLVAGRIERRDRRWIGLAALAGAAAGAGLGLRYPLPGSILGGLAGAFLGSICGALGARAGRDGIGPFFALSLAMAAKVGAGIAIATFTLVTLYR